MKERFDVCANIDECLSGLTSKEHKRAVALSRKRMERSQLLLSNEVHCFEKMENIQNYSLSLHVRKDFEHKAEVNEIIRNAVEAGLIQKWANDELPGKSCDDFDNCNTNTNQQIDDTIVLAIVLSLVLLVIAAEVVVNNRIEALNRYNLSIFVHKLFTR